ncbi:hypothetical protein F5Y13DRAFT_204451 [Hypoxylon sp. FL1857]|nr:hypothetical protein F5Y13DRAFT_204451 [Hypoxylon sp. FL1857]
MADQHSQAPGTTNQGVASGSFSPDLRRLPSQNMPMRPPDMPSFPQPANGGYYEAWYGRYWPSRGVPPAMNGNARPRSLEPTNDTDTRALSSKNGQNHSPESSATQPGSRPNVPEQAEESFGQFRHTLSMHIKELHGSHLREIILSLCLNSSAINKAAIRFVKQKEAERGVTIQYPLDGLGMHLWYLPMQELEALILFISEQDQSERMRETIKNYVLTAEDRKAAYRAIS